MIYARKKLENAEINEIACKTVKSDGEIRKRTLDKKGFELSKKVANISGSQVKIVDLLKNLEEICSEGDILKKRRIVKATIRENGGCLYEFLILQIK